MKGRHLLPIQSLLTLTDAGIQNLSVNEISYSSVGHKAYGLCSLPREWVPRLFLVNSSCLHPAYSNQILTDRINDCLSCLEFPINQKIIIRSSGITETILDRGQLPSQECSSSEIVSTIKDLITKLPAHVTADSVHWIVQEYIDSKLKGHLSNERRLKEEKRDWIAEFEPPYDRAYTIPLGVRAWRDGKDLPEGVLQCNAELQISKRLKPVAMWATQLTPRTHFEWVWDGNTIYVVQADTAELQDGVKPYSLLPTQIHCVQPNALRIFHLATDNEYLNYKKLENAKLYRDFGYHMPDFYLVDNSNVITNLLKGIICSDLEHDLNELTKRPLIIRTDGANIPSEQREMLPRSDELRSAHDAKNWLLQEFADKISEANLTNSNLCLIAHHFIPSVASAWARAVPSERIVRIESLWGIPEGLYWYPHDTNEVDTQTIRIDCDASISSLDYKVSDRRRYKGRFIASNNEGKWIPYQTAPPHDWRSSIRKEAWLFEIARTTRLVAEHTGHPISLMWFIDNHSQATTHRVLPWFHSISELAGPPKAVPRHKRSTASDFTIKTNDDWQKLQQDLSNGWLPERVVVEPVDPELIRNQEFTIELANLAARYGFIVHLSGGILSHAYYMLQRAGAQVECVDLFGADEDVVEYNKVVRDKIPDYIEERGEHVETVQLVGDALITALRRKMVEESFEVLDAKSEEELVGELADIQEVIIGLCNALNVPLNRVDTVREEKRARRGGFDKGLMLIKTATPHSIHKQSKTSNPIILDLQQDSTVPISNPTDLPTKPVYRRPDLRQMNDQAEKLLTFGSEVNTMGEVQETLSFAMPQYNARTHNFNLTVELRRKGAVIRGVVRLRSTPSQIPLDIQGSQLTLEFSD